jgi:hypothetical protein
MKIHNEWDIIQSAETILQNSGANIVHTNQGRAFYRPSTDMICLPLKTAFPSATDYYGTALHELAHWSGAKHRLNRETLTASGGFKSQDYAREELRAELASVFLMAERGIPYNLDDNASYIGGWLKALKEDKNEIFRAARDAQKAADFLLALELNKSMEQALDEADGKPLTAAEPVAAETSAVEITEKQKETAYQLGQTAFLNGSLCIPAKDAELMDMTRKINVLGAGAHLAKAWLDGWTAENLKAPVNEAVASGIKEEIKDDRHFIRNVPFDLNKTMRDLGGRWDFREKCWYHTNAETAKEAERLVQEYTSQRLPPAIQVAREAAFEM